MENFRLLSMLLVGSAARYHALKNNSIGSNGNKKQDTIITDPYSVERLGSF
ncbi:MAG: hypothetical protein FWH23_06340 [Bacteroidales bacterium]|nr:hypothetical protein [Bacteroidales bacterium]